MGAETEIMAKDDLKPNDRKARRRARGDLEDLLAQLDTPLDEKLVEGGMKRLAKFLGRAPKSDG